MNVLERQTALYRLGFDPQGLDGVQGKNTDAAIAAFLESVGEMGGSPAHLDELLAGAATRAGLPQFIQARNFTRAHRTRLDLIVVHTAEAPEIHAEAFNVATFFATQRPGNDGSSAHYVVDDAGVVQCVCECDEAWAAPGANGNGVHLEHAGFARQTEVDWADPYSTAVLANSAKLAARIAKRFGIPVVRLGVDELKAHGRGFCGHVDVTNALNGGKGHTDPGPNFPWGSYLDAVAAELAALSAT